LSSARSRPGPWVGVWRVGWRRPPPGGRRQPTRQTPKRFRTGWGAERVARSLARRPLKFGNPSCTERLTMARRDSSRPPASGLPAAAPSHKRWATGRRSLRMTTCCKRRCARNHNPFVAQHRVLRERNAPAQNPFSLFSPFPRGGKGAGGMGAASKVMGAGSSMRRRQAPAPRRSPISRPASHSVARGRTPAALLLVVAGIAPPQPLHLLAALEELVERAAGFDAAVL